MTNRGMDVLTDDALRDALHSIGYAAFVTGFAVLTDGTLPRATAVARLREICNWTEAGCGWRVGRAAVIVQAKRIDDALALVAGARKVPEKIRTEARRLLAERRAVPRP